MKYNGLNECQTTPLWGKRASARRVMAKNSLFCVAVHLLNPLPICLEQIGVQPRRGEVQGCAEHATFSAPCSRNFYPITGLFN